MRFTYFGIGLGLAVLAALALALALVVVVLPSNPAPSTMPDCTGIPQELAQKVGEMAAVQRNVLKRTDLAIARAELLGILEKDLNDIRAARRRLASDLENNEACLEQAGFELATN